VADPQAKVPTKISKGAQGNVLETLRAEEAASMSEKDVLSSKISEMLRDTKGKISMVATANKGTSSNASSLLSDQMTVATKTSPVSAQMASTTAMSTVTEATQQAEIPFSLQPVASTPAPVAQQASTDPSLSGNSTIQGAAIPGVEASSSNSASQANMAARVSTQAGSPAEQVSTQMTAAIKDGANKIKIQLHPADLGRVDIQLELSHDGRVMAVISADKQESLDLLKQDSKLLEQALKDAGFETDSDSLNFSLNQQNNGEDRSKSANSSSNNPMDEDSIEDIPSPLPLQAYKQSSTSNLDIQV
ncbi:MAG: flagellar hook-length control protein FliK, partial [Sneathiella sp.]|nr:flagellar hook-length control protein FliK [Sneathiella sp.]